MPSPHITASAEGNPLMKTLNMIFGQEVAPCFFATKNEAPAYHASIDF
jgi:hypothetical protein